MKTAGQYRAESNFGAENKARQEMEVKGTVNFSCGSAECEVSCCTLQVMLAYDTV